MAKATTHINASFSDAIYALRLPLAVMIVCVHNGIGAYKYNHMLSSIFATAVGVFFFISGYLSFSKITRYSLEQYKSHIKNKAIRLLMPYCFWNLLCALPALSMPSPKEFSLLGYIFYCPDYPAWFLATLFEVELLLAPLFLILHMKNHKKNMLPCILFMIFAFMLLYDINDHEFEIFHHWFFQEFLRGAFFWLCGFYCYINGINPIVLCKKILIPAIIIVGVTLSFRYFKLPHLFPVLELGMVICIIAMCPLLVPLFVFWKNIPSTYYMFLYLSHAIFVQPVAFFLQEKLSLSCSVAYYLFPFCILTICTILFFTVRKVPLIFDISVGIWSRRAK